MTTNYLMTSVGECPNCGGALFAGTKSLKNLKRTTNVIKCHKCWFIWPANEDEYRAFLRGWED